MSALTLAAALAPACAHEAAVPRADPPYPPWMIDLMGRMPALDPERMLLGDSLVAMWPPDLQRQVTGGAALNFGAGGDTTLNLLWRVEGAFRPGMHLKSALILIGTNDLPQRSGAAIAADIAEIVDRIRSDAPQACITVVGLLPRRDGRGDFSAKIEEANRRLAGLAASHVRFVDAGGKLARSCPSSGACDLYIDAVHLTRPGYERLSAAIARAQAAHPCG